MSSLVTVASFTTMPEAALAKARLESNGIPAVVHGEQHTRLFGGMGAAAGTIDLLVVREDEDAARAVLAMDLSGYDEELTALEAEHAEAPQVESFSPREHCPHCGSETFFVAQHPGMKVFLSMFLLGLPLLFIKRRHECAICGTVWRA